MGALNLRIVGRYAYIEFDQPDSKVNVLSESVLNELSGLLDDVKRHIHKDISVLFITSRKPGIFIAGADIKEIDKISSQEEGEKKSQLGKKVLRKISELDILSMAVINGACLGGGLEVALFCKYRIASFSPAVKIGLPEVRLGIIPGFGGTQLLPRLVGLKDGLGMILAGKVLSAKDSLKIGLVDRLAPENRLLDDAELFAEELLKKKDVDKIPRRKSSKGFTQFLLEDNPIGRYILLNRAKKNVLKKTKGFYPAPLKAIGLIGSTFAGRDLDNGFELESKIFGSLVTTEVCRNLIKVFYLNERFKKFNWVDISIKKREIKRCGVVGAGVMGGGISQLLTNNNIPTRIKDINIMPLKKSLMSAYSIYMKALKRRRLKANEVEFKFGLISPTLTYKGFKGVDLVIEAVVEDIGIKQAVFKELNSIVSKDTILASNTSSIPILNFTKVVDYPERVVGMHFFNPVHLMPLVEIIKTEYTTSEVLATVIEFARKIGKVVIIVKDVPGFLINRILLCYLNEAGYLIQDGVGIKEVDRVVKGFGMPVGPIELIDEIGIDVGYKVINILEGAYGKRMSPPKLMKELKEGGLLGRKSKEGFYIYKGSKKKIPNKRINSFLKRSAKRTIFDEKTILERMIYVMINEAARCLEEEIVQGPDVIDLGMFMGTGFPAFRGGLLRYADSIGLQKIIDRLKYFQEKIDPDRFTPCRYLIERASKGGLFY